MVSIQVLDGADCMIQNGMEAFLRDVFDQASTCMLLYPFLTLLNSLTTNHAYSIYRSNWLNHISLALRVHFCGLAGIWHHKIKEPFILRVFKPFVRLCKDFQQWDQLNYRISILTGFMVTLFFLINLGRQTGVFSSTWEPEIEQVVKGLVSETDLVKVSF